MQAMRIVALAPSFHDDPRLVQRIEEFPVQQLIPQIPVKGFDIFVLPRTARLDE